MSDGLQICFLRVSDQKTKLARICAVVQQHYFRGDRILIHVDNEAAETYLDDLLWNEPKNSFLPHSVARNSSRDRVVITSLNRNLNEASVLINLCSGANAGVQGYSLVYELADQTSEQRAQLARSRYQHYQKLGLALAVL